MGMQRSLGCLSGIRRSATPVQLPGACVRGSNSRLRCCKRRLVRPAAAIGFSEAPVRAVSDAESAASPAVPLPRPSPQHAHPHQHQHPQQPAQHVQQQLRQQQQQHEAAHQLVQRLVPPTPVACATKLPTRGGVGAGGIALGILLTVALQMAGRWLQRQRWGQQLLDLLDLRRSSGSSASTSDSPSGEDDEAGGARRDGRKGGSNRSSSTGAEGSTASSSSSAAAAAARSAFLGGAAGSAPGSHLGSLDGAGGGTAAAQAGPGAPPAGGPGPAGMPPPSGMPPGADPGESVEWVNMCWRKVWRVYQRGLEGWIIDLLQPVFDGLVKDGSVPRWLCRLRVVELTLDHEAPYFSNMRRRNSRKDSDLNGVVDIRYTGGARMLLMLELGEGRWRFKVPVLVSDLDLECQMWLKLRLAPMCPWIGTISLAFVGPPNVKVQLSPYNRVRLMRVPVVQNYLRKLLTVDLPGLMVLPQRLEINIPPSVTTIAEAAVGRDTIMRAVASAVLQADAVEAALLAALPLGPQTPAGGITLPEAFKGELGVTLREARNLPVWGFPGQSNPYCRLLLGDQAVQSRREGDTSHPGRHRAPVWNQEFQFLVKDPAVQVLEMIVKDSHLTGRTEVGRASIRLEDLLAAEHGPEGGKVSMWVTLQPTAGSYGITGGEAVPTGEVLVDLSYKAFDDEEQDSGCREAEKYSKQAASQAPITDIRSAAAASSRAAVAASAAISAIAMTRAAAARAAARAARAAQEAAAAAAGAAKGAVDQGASMIGQQPLAVLPPAQLKQLPAASTTAAALPKPPVSGAQPATSTHGSASPDATTIAAAAAAAKRQRRLALPAALPAAGASDTDAGTAAPAGTNGDGGAAAHLLSAAGGAAALRVRVVVGEEEEEEARGGVPLAVEARAIGLVAPGGSAAVATATATATATALSASKATTSVIERPPVLEHLAGAGGGGRDGPSYGHYPRNNGGGEGANGGGQLPSGAGEPHWDSAAGSGGGGGLDHSAAGAEAALGRSPDDGQGRLPLHVVSPVQRLLDTQLPQQQAPLEHSLAEPIDVAAEVVAQGEAGRPAPAAGGGGGGAVSPVLSALAQLTASAHSLTNTALEKARETLAHQLPPQQQPGKEKEDAAEGGGGNWLDAIVSRLPRYGGGSQQHHAGEEEEGEGRRKGGRGKDAEGSASADAAGGQEGEGEGEEHPWWQFWVSKGGDPMLADYTDADAAAATAAGSEASGEGDVDGKAGRKPWWQFWSDGDKEGQRGKEGEAGGRGDEGSKPVEAIYIPPDLPLEEIAAEVQRLKEDSWRERSDHVSNLWMKAVERNDRKWLMLAAFLLSVAVGLLTVVAWRLEQLEHLQAVVPEVALMTMQAALQALEQHASGGGGGGMV